MDFLVFVVVPFALVALLAALVLLAAICAFRAARIEARLDELVAAERRRSANGTRPG